MAAAVDAVRTGRIGTRALRLLVALLLRQPTPLPMLLEDRWAEGGLERAAEELRSAELLGGTLERPTFPAPAVPEALRPYVDRIDAGRLELARPLPLPSAHLRLLAAERQAATLVVYLATALRCAWRDEQGELDLEGRCAARFVSEISGLARRQVHRARARLRALGIHSPALSSSLEPETQLFGPRLRLPAAPVGVRAPQRARRVPPPDTAAAGHRTNMSGDMVSENLPPPKSMPTRARETRDAPQGKTSDRTRLVPLRAPTHATAPRDPQRARPSPRSSPRLRIPGQSRADLEDTRQVLEDLLPRLAAQGVMNLSPASEQLLLALVDRALDRGKRNPGGMLYRLLEGHVAIEQALAQGQRPPCTEVSAKNERRAQYRLEQYRLRGLEPAGQRTQEVASPFAPQIRGPRALGALLPGALEELLLVDRA